MIKAAVAAPLALGACGGPATRYPREAVVARPDTELQHIITLPFNSGAITGMIAFEDMVLISTDHGKVYALRWTGGEPVVNRL